MIATRSSAIDVFLSQAASNRDAADSVARRLDDAGMSVRFDRDILIPGKSWETALRKALIESDAFVLVVDPTQAVLPHSNFELGAVAALHKPVFIVLTDKRGTAPSYLRRYPAFAIDSIDKLAAAIQDACQPLSADQRDSLVRIYQQRGVPSDRLLSDPVAIEGLGEEFRKSTGGRVHDGQLASELLRLRKTGRLPRIRSTKGKQ